MKETYKPTKEEKDNIKKIAKSLKKYSEDRKKHPEKFCMCWACQVGEFTVKAKIKELI